MKLQEKVFIVTGAGSGIGRSLVKRLIQHGAHIAAVDRNHDSLEKLAADLGQTSSRVSIHTLDISSRIEVERLSKTITDIHGSIDGLINNAGIIQPFVTIKDLDYGTIERVMNTNFYGSLYMTKTFLPSLLDRPEAYIVNVSSMGGFLPVPGQGIYGASKAAMKLMSESLYAELLDTSVHVSTVFPGATKTNIADSIKFTPTTTSQPLKTTMLSPDKAAEIIIRGIEKNQPLIYTGKDSTLMSRIYRFDPAFATKLIAKQMRSLLK